jgi:hypothetical protein
MLLVLGPHRSGTSLSTRMLECLGAVNSTNLNPPNKYNEKGYFEDWDIYQFNDKILLPALGSSWSSLGEIDWKALNPEELARLRAEAGLIVSRNYPYSNRVSVLKEPRISRLLPFWLPVLKQAGFDIRCILVVRDPLSVARSLQQRNNMAIAHGAMLYLQDWVDILTESQKLPSSWIRFDSILESPETVLRMVAEKLSILLPPDFDQRVAEFSTLHLDKNLRHNVAEASDIQKDPLLPPLAAEFHRLLHATTCNQESSALFEFATRTKAMLTDIGPMLIDYNNHINLSRAHSCTPFIQIFANTGSGYSEKYSTKKPLKLDDWQVIAFPDLQLLQTNGSHKFRIDLINLRGIIHVASIRILSNLDGSVLYNASSEADFQQLKHSSGMLLHFTGERLLVVATDRVSHLWLPRLLDVSSGSYTLEINLRAEICGRSL